MSRKRQRAKTRHLATRINSSSSAMATHGSLSEFDSTKDDWTSYVERVDFYFIANDVTSEAKKRAILLSACGASTFKLIRSLVDTGKLNSTSYKDLVELVKNHYDPKPSVTVQRHKFNTRIREPGESVAQYIAALRQIAKHCDYKDSLNEMLKDRLVCGVNHVAIRQKLLSQKTLTYATAVELAQTIETAEKDAQHIKDSTASSTPQEVHRLVAPMRGRRGRRERERECSY